MANSSSRIKSLNLKKIKGLVLRSPAQRGDEGRCQTVSPKGFTLIEILIVITLMGILAIPVMGTYFKSQQRARDAVRKHNISEISNALEEFYGVCGFNYPAAAAYGTILNGGSISCAVGTFMSKVPVDPQTNNPYTCTGCTNTTYQLCGVLEAEVAPTPTGFCLSNRQ